MGARRASRVCEASRTVLSSASPCACCPPVQLHKTSQSKAVYLSLAANAVRLAATTTDIADLPRVAAGEPKSVAEGGLGRQGGGVVLGERFA